MQINAFGRYLLPVPLLFPWHRVPGSTVMPAALWALPKSGSGGGAMLALPICLPDPAPIPCFHLESRIPLRSGLLAVFLFFFCIFGPSLDDFCFLRSFHVSLIKGKNIPN